MLIILSKIYKMFQRSHYQVLAERLLEHRRFIQVIVGPRQVGKTTMVKQVASQLKVPYLFVSADDVALGNRIWLQQQWELARIKLKQENAAEFVLIIDEIQKIDQWSETIKSLWDEDTRLNVNIKLVLLGSSRLLIQNGLTESLMGRFEVIYMGHWSFSEMQSSFDFSFEDFIWFGGYPGSAALIKDEVRWKEYMLHSIIESSISRDILMLTRIDKPALMKKLFELGCLYAGQILSYTKMIGQLQDAGNTTTLSHYLTLLHTAGLLGGIEKFAGDVIRKRSSSPKFQVHNNALISAQLLQTKKQVMSDAAAWGRMVESAVGAHILNSSLTNHLQLFYWRENILEVDFILEKNNELIALELKSNDEADFRGLDAFKKLYNPKKTILVGAKGIPVSEFLQMNPVELF